MEYIKRIIVVVIIVCFKINLRENDNKFHEIKKVYNYILISF